MKRKLVIITKIINCQKKVKKIKTGIKMVQYNLKLEHTWEVTIRFLRVITPMPNANFDHPSNWEQLELNWHDTGIFVENSPFNQLEKYNISFKSNIEIRLAPLIHYPHIKEINSIEFVFRGMERASHLELNFDRGGDYLKNTRVYLIADNAVNIFERSNFNAYDHWQNEKWQLDEF